MGDRGFTRINADKDKRLTAIEERIKDENQFG
jgi:hypothetical protein